MNANEQFREAILTAGLYPPDAIEAGRFYRFPGEGKGRSNSAGWCKLFDDGMGGVFGDYSTGLSSDWHAKREKPLNQAEREAFKRQIQEAREQAEADRKQQQAAAAERAAAIWQQGQTDPANHGYPVKKGIQAHGVRVADDGRLIVPMYADGKLQSIQYIAEDGQKRFLTGGRVTGCYFPIGKPDGVLCLCEGFATGASVREATGYAVAVAFNAGNLEPVALALRVKFPDLRLIVCADDDYQTEGNPGLSKATEAARAVGGLLAVPDFGGNRPEGATDFNDLHQAHGPEVVASAIANAKAPARDEYQPGDSKGTGWPEPQPLTAKVEAEDYPVEALPGTIRAAVEEVHGFVKAPLPMVASSALAALSLAIQAHVDVKRAERLSGPVGKFFLTIADSGERKSTCDGFFMKAIRDYQDAQAEAAKPLLADYRADFDAWEAKRNGIKEKIRQQSKAGKPTLSDELALRELEHSKPELPRVPRLIYADVTPEAMAYGLARHWPSGAVISSEAGIVFGSHGMSKESVMRNLGLLNQLWDGTSLTIDRRSTESFTVRGARLTVALQVQEPTLREFFRSTGALARGTGFLARFLVAWPESTQGYRPFTEAPASWPHLETFHRRITAILEQPIPMDDDGALTPALLSLDREAKIAWIAFHDAIEGELASGGELYDVRDVASKSADNAARLAALFQIFEHGQGGAIGAEAFQSASQIVAWHLHESRRFFGALALPQELADAARLDCWLIDYYQRGQTHIVGKNHVRRHGPLRDGGRLDAAIKELIDLDRLRLLKDGKRLTLHLNPALVGVAL